MSDLRKYFQQAKEEAKELLNKDRIKEAIDEFKELRENIGVKKDKYVISKKVKVKVNRLILNNNILLFLHEFFILVKNQYKETSIISNTLNCINIDERQHDTRELFFYQLYPDCYSQKRYKVLGVAGSIMVCVFALILFLVRPTVDKVQEMKSSGNLEGIQNVLIDVKDSWIYKDVRLAAIKAIVELEKYNGDIWLNKFVHDNKESIHNRYHYSERNEELAGEIIQIRKDVINENIQKDFNYVNKKIRKYIHYASIKSQYMDKISVYFNLQQTFEGLGYEKEVENAIASDILRQLDIFDKYNAKNIKEQLEDVKFSFGKFRKYTTLIDIYFEKEKERDKLQKRYDSIDDIIKGNLDEQRQIQQYFRTQDAIVRNIMKQIYETQGLDAALRYNQSIAEENHKKLDRNFEIFNENKQLKVEKENLPSKIEALRKECLEILRGLKKQGTDYYYNIVPNFPGEILGEWTDMEGNVKLTLTDTTLNNNKIRKLTYNDAVSYSCDLDINGEIKTVNLSWSLSNPDWKILNVGDDEYYRIKKNNNYTRFLTTFTSLQQIIKQNCNIDISFVYAEQKDNPKYKDIRIMFFDVNYPGGKERVTVYESNGIIWQVLGRNICGRLIYCSDEKVYTFGAFLPRLNGRGTIYSGEEYDNIAWELATGKFKVHPKI